MKKEKIDNELETKLKAKKVEQEVFPVEINYNLSLKEMIKRGFYYDYAYGFKNINSSNFLITGEGVVKAKLELMYFNRDTSYACALVEMRRQGYRPARIEELIAFGSIYRQRARCYSRIVALGSSWFCPTNSKLTVPSITNGYNFDNRLNLDLFLDVSEIWNHCYRFLVVRESEEAICREPAEAEEYYTHEDEPIEEPITEEEQEEWDARIEMQIEDYNDRKRFPGDYGLADDEP